jgi:hypothetical protein
LRPQVTYILRDAELPPQLSAKQLVDLAIKVGAGVEDVTSQLSTERANYLALLKRMTESPYCNLLLR